MYKIKPLYCLWIIFFLCPIWANAQERTYGDLSLWYDKPAKIWEEALPLGNGKTGAMVFGDVHRERFQLNDNTLWSAQPEEGNNPEAALLLPLLRQQIFDTDYAGAEETWHKMQGPYSASYLPLGDLWLQFDYGGDTTVRDYKRTLDISTAIASVAYSVNGIDFTRETFISHPSGVMMVQIKASKAGALNFSVGLSSRLKYTTRATSSRLVMKGKAPKYVSPRTYYPQQLIYDDKQGMDFEAQVAVKAKGGSVVMADSILQITGADEVTLYLAEASSFNGFDKDAGLEGKDPAIIVDKILKKALRQNYEQLRQIHLQDYQSLFNRVSFQLASKGEQWKLVTNERLKRFANDPTDHALQVLYYQFGRYLMIACSRAGGRPSNLQGIWNDLVQPPWRSNYTININTEMNYWPAENTNLSECHMPLLDFIKELAINGAKTAKINYGIDEGWLAHHNSDLWAKTSPVGDFEKDKMYLPGAFCWHMGGAWLSTHLWEHYLYTRDKRFLKKHGYPLMKGAAQFMLKWLVADPETGYLITAPSTSPENQFMVDGKPYHISKAATMDIAIVRELFQDVVVASKELNKDKTFREELVHALDKLYPYQIGQHGQLQEWFEDIDDPNDSHRHISHLFGLFPGNQIDPDSTAAFAAAARQTLFHRGDVSTGWSMAWKMNWWARLKDGDHAYKILTKAFNYINPSDKNVKSAGGGGTYPNMFDAHPPFQIDGNFGATAGITEMLMQSHNDVIDLLPALPLVWEEGAIAGIKARGNFEIAIAWKEGKLQECKVKSLKGGLCKLKYIFPLEAVGLDEEVLQREGNVLSFETKKGGIYTFRKVVSL